MYSKLSTDAFIISGIMESKQKIRPDSRLRFMDFDRRFDEKEGSSLTQTDSYEK
jgi:hypothetical protein